VTTVERLNRPGHDDLGRGFGPLIQGSPDAQASVAHSISTSFTEKGQAVESASLKGKVAVITGASTGIGRACAAVFAREGMKVVLAARRSDRLEVAVSALASSGADVLGVPTNVGDYDDVQRLADAAMTAYGRVDIALLNAGIGSGSSLLDIDLSSWHDSVHTNIFGLVHGIKAFLPLLRQTADPGSILATSSAAGVQGTHYTSAAYAATKNAQVTIMEALYGQLRDAGSSVHVGVVLPPLVRSNLVGDDLELWTEIEKRMAGAPGAPALIEPHEFAEVVLEGIRERAFWIEPSEEQNMRLFAGRDAGAPIRKAKLIGRKADAMLNRTTPDRYLW
jgi:NAD(P)-dependent dehydrogenase (short-subunit alcohol dehydrogenase family)